MASNFYDRPSEQLQLVGVTGTNGKTSTVRLLYGVFQRMGHSVGVISTIGNAINEHSYPATHTTPDPLVINAFLQKMVQAGVGYCFMEVSSHGIDQHRTAGLTFSGGVFTNLSHDHLDYHETFAQYRDTKKQFFDQLPREAFALSNKDDKNGSYMLQNTLANHHFYAAKSSAHYKVKILERDFAGMLLSIDNKEIWTPLVGDFNAVNLLAVYACCRLLGKDAEESLHAMSAIEPVAGRFNAFTASDKIKAIVDFAHTPDALENVLSSINKIRTGNEMLITVVGCGGGRDVDKRPKMGRIATLMSDKVIFTSDNPRTEDPQLIIQHMEQGVAPEDFKKFLSIPDRKQAIKAACQMAHPNDIILVAGKGHETYQEIQGVKIDFDDLTELKSNLKISD
jgi:UDP-N-acetylmuramoyl-L-alanyl-D-glutamate--2,6-diaminopimelate ligase